MKDASPAQPPVERKDPTPHPVPGAAVSPHRATLVDVGSGAGFPGLPIKIWASHLRVTLIESNQKKATFLREIIRALTLTDIDVFPGRSEDYLRAAFPQPRPGQDSSTMPADTAPHAPARADFVTLRAVERFESALPEAAKLVRPGGCLATLIGESQIARAIALVPAFAWRAPVPIPLSTSRALLVGSSPTCPSAPPSFPRNHSR